MGSLLLNMSKHRDAKKARDNKLSSASSSSSSLPTPERSRSESSSSSAPERTPERPSSSSSPDEWALMTSERLDAMTYEERCDIYPLSLTPWSVR